MMTLSTEADTKESRELLFISLYKKVFPVVAAYISKRGGSFEESKDIFHDALVIYYEKIIIENRSVQTTQHAYIVGIAKHLWSEKYKQNQKSQSLSGMTSDVPQEGEDGIPQEKKILSFLEHTGKKCMEMLQAFYYNRMSMEDLAGSFGYSSVRSATVQKYKCLEKVRDSIKAKSMSYEDFFE